MLFGSLTTHQLHSEWNLKQALFACEFLQGFFQLTWWILLSFHGRKYSSSRILWRSKSDLFTKPQAWFVQGHEVIYSEYPYLHSSSMPRSEAVSRSPWRLWNWRLFGWALSCASCVEGCENDAKGVCKLCKKTQPGTWHFTWCCPHSLLLPPWLVCRDGVGPHLILSQHQQADCASKASQGDQTINHATSCIPSHWQWTSFCWLKCCSSRMWCMIFFCSFLLWNSK